MGRWQPVASAEQQGLRSHRLGPMAAGGLQASVAQPSDSSFVLLVQLWGLVCLSWRSTGTASRSRIGSAGAGRPSAAPPRVDYLRRHITAVLPLLRGGASINQPISQPIDQPIDRSATTNPLPTSPTCLQNLPPELALQNLPSELAFRVGACAACGVKVASSHPDDDDV